MTKPCILMCVISSLASLCPSSTILRNCHITAKEYSNILYVYEMCRKYTGTEYGFIFEHHCLQFSHFLEQCSFLCISLFDQLRFWTERQVWYDVIYLLLYIIPQLCLVYLIRNSPDIAATNAGFECLFPCIDIANNDKALTTIRSNNSRVPIIQ